MKSGRSLKLKFINKKEIHNRQQFHEPSDLQKTHIT